jgi:hypothetical protein
MTYLLNKLLPDDNSSNDNECHKLLRLQMTEEIETENDEEFTFAEINEIINNLKPNKTPGFDQFNQQIVKVIFETSPEFIVNLFNKCLQLNYFPNIWKISIIKPILKSEQKPKHETSSYRLISLLPLFGKILEKLLINRINYHLYSNNHLSSNQFGFRPQSSTQMAVQKLVNKVKHQLSKKQFLLFTSLDIRGAFDNAFWPKILFQSKEKSVRKIFITQLKVIYVKEKRLLSLAMSLSQKH